MACVRGCFVREKGFPHSDALLDGGQGFSRIRVWNSIPLQATGELDRARLKETWMLWTRLRA
jgi:hypothetical protein